MIMFNQNKRRPHRTKIETSKIGSVLVLGGVALAFTTLVLTTKGRNDFMTGVKPSHVIQIKEVGSVSSETIITDEKPSTEKTEVMSKNVHLNKHVVAVPYQVGKAPDEQTVSKIVSDMKQYAPDSDKATEAIKTYLPDENQADTTVQPEEKFVFYVDTTTNEILPNPEVTTPAGGL